MRKSPLLLSILAALSACSETFDDKGCMNVPAEQTTCPGAGSVKPEQLYLPNLCGDDLEITEVKSGGTREDLGTQAGTLQPACCYTVEVVDHNTSAECAIGRPYYDEGAAIAAPLRSEGPRGHATGAGPRPQETCRAAPRRRLPRRPTRNQTPW